MVYYHFVFIALEWFWKWWWLCDLMNWLSSRKHLPPKYRKRQNKSKLIAPTKQRFTNGWKKTSNVNSSIIQWESMPIFLLATWTEEACLQNEEPLTLPVGVALCALLFCSFLWVNKQCSFYSQALRAQEYGQNLYWTRPLSLFWTFSAQKYNSICIS